MNSPVFSTSHDTSEPLDHHGWIDWTGGSCPVPGASVAVRLRDGRTTYSSQADAFRWKHDGRRGDIVAFRCLPASWAERGTARPEGEAAIHDVLAERQRQKTVEGWTSEHDDQHDDGQMALAAACYALPDWQRHQIKVDTAVGPHDLVRRLWPWAWGWWKPKDVRRDLVRAAALLIAEIERIDRARQRAVAKAETGLRERLARKLCEAGHHAWPGGDNGVSDYNNAAQRRYWLKLADAALATDLTPRTAASDGAAR